MVINDRWLIWSPSTWYDERQQVRSCRQIQRSGLWLDESWHSIDHDWLCGNKGRSYELSDAKQTGLYISQERQVYQWNSTEEGIVGERRRKEQRKSIPTTYFCFHTSFLKTKRNPTGCRMKCIIGIGGLVFQDWMNCFYWLTAGVQGADEINELLILNERISVCSCFQCDQWWENHPDQQAGEDLA